MARVRPALSHDFHGWAAYPDMCEKCRLEADHDRYVDARAHGGDYNHRRPASSSTRSPQGGC